MPPLLFQLPHPFLPSSLAAHKDIRLFTKIKIESKSRIVYKLWNINPGRGLYQSILNKLTRKLKPSGI
jgi:hypothetical protein